MTKSPKVNLKLIEQTKELRNKGYTQEAIAVELGVSQGTISIVLRASGMGGYLVRKPSTFSMLKREVK